MRLTLRITGSLAPQPAGQIAWWRFSDNPLDSVASFHGIWGNGTPTYADGFIGRAASFNFTDYIQLPNDVFPTLDRSFETWFRTTNFGAILGQFQNGGSGYVPAAYIGTDGKLRVSFFYGGNATPFTTANAWKERHVGWNDAPRTAQRRSPEYPAS